MRRALQRRASLRRARSRISRKRCASSWCSGSAGIASTRAGSRSTRRSTDCRRPPSEVARALAEIESDEAPARTANRRRRRTAAGGTGRDRSATAAKCARWSAAATSRRAASTVRRRRSASPARPSSRSSTPPPSRPATRRRRSSTDLDDPIATPARRLGARRRALTAETMTMRTALRDVEQPRRGADAAAGRDSRDGRLRQARSASERCRRAVAGARFRRGHAAVDDRRVLGVRQRGMLRAAVAHPPRRRHSGQVLFETERETAQRSVRRRRS